MGLEEDPETGVEALQAEIDVGVDGVEELEDLQIIDTDRDEQQYLAELQNKILDRLAETLARFKSDPKARNSFDAKHVSSAMMVVYRKDERVKILCSKNEGLDTEDRDFLRDWKDCMETIARRGAASEENETNMFNLVFRHQRPRIMRYLELLKLAFQAKKSTAYHRSKESALLVESQLESQPFLKTRSWIDDNGFEFTIPTNLLAQDDDVSETIATGESLENADIGVSDLFEKVHKLCAEKSQRSQEILLKQVMRNTFDLWKGWRTRSAIKAYLHRYFGESRKQKKEAEKVLLFLCKIYYGAHIFIEAAEKLPAFKYIQCVPIQYQASGPNKDTSSGQTTLLEVANSLGVTVQQPSWIGYLKREGTRFKTLLEEKRRKPHVHAEIQVLHHHDVLSSSDERRHTHPYVGCSRRCCLLCYFFILAYGGFGVRGTHQTIMHRWEIPENNVVSKAHAITTFRSATERLLDAVKSILRELFKMAFPISQSELLAQSSDALSSARTILEKESAQLEKSHLELE
ncbi:hypothetical protein LTR96_011628 [Exophiala xenobiotica]|nr:hypothetical protein LTR72_011962 [Exophiala xenobiotica]KAK5262916.1 hypothetical protein LTR96_011628 [Exophiala xenobiotica]KAK5283278.1 hypothetical protein LTR14_011904 [Exophiala xenobiotica]KAK5332254.1 hypothetical protein LTR98_011611 [Exophiala xenobiotica]KAK5461845.1 hypothetical protein LTR55_011907 [Exophiala xenobiotica]